MSISAQARKRFRLILQSLEDADEILDLLEEAAADSVNYSQSFTVGNWVSAEAGDLYSLTVTHNLNKINVQVSVRDTTGQLVQPHRVSIPNSNQVIIYVTQSSADARFAGTVTVDV